MKTILALIFCLIFITQNYAGYGCQGSFRGLSISNDYIVIGEISSWELCAKNNEFILTVSIEEIVKGELNNKMENFLIKVGSTAHLEYENGSRNIFFFRKIDLNDSSYYITNYCSIIEINSTNDKVKIDRIKEIVNILEIDNYKTQNQHLIDWCIKCLKDETTRYHGIIELSVRGPLYDYDSKKEIYVRNRKYNVSKNQKKELLHYFLNRDTLMYNDVFYIDLIRKNNKSEILSKMIDQLKMYDGSERVFFREFNLMSKIVELSQRKDLGLIYNKIERIGFYKGSEDLDKLTKEFIDTI